MVQDVRTAAEPAVKSVEDMTPQEAQAELSKREADKMTRRAALAKIGLRAGLGVLAALSIDDLARLVARRMDQQAGQNAAVDKVARELRGAGLALADVDPVPEPPCDAEGPETPNCSKCTGKCNDCCNTLKTSSAACGTLTDPGARTICFHNAGVAFTGCKRDNGGCNCAC